MQEYKAYWKNYTNFNDRTTRKGYWLVFLFNFIISIIFTVLIGATKGFSLTDFSSIGGPVWIIYSIWSLANVIPGLAILVRRLHDIGKAWTNIFFAFIPFAGAIIILVFALTGSKPQEQNRFGNQPQV